MQKRAQAFRQEHARHNYQAWAAGLAEPWAMFHLSLATLLGPSEHWTVTDATQWGYYSVRQAQS